MAEMDFGREEGALCPLHPGRVATGTCTRCGNFMCDACSQGGAQALCPTCRERVGAEAPAFALSRENWSVGALLETCWDAFKREWVMICVGFLIFIAASMVGSVVSQVLGFMSGLSDHWGVKGVFIVTGYLLSTVLQGLVTLGYLRMLFDVLDGRKADLGRLFTQFHKAVPYLLTTLLSFVVMVPVLLLVVGGVLGTLALSGGLSALQGADWMGAAGSQDTSAELVRVMRELGPSLLLAMFVGVALYCFPGGWLLMPLALLQPELARSENPTALGTLRRCFAYARGERLSMLGVLLLGIPLGLAGTLACCVGLIPAMGLLQLLIAGLYLTLSNGVEEG